MIPRDRAAKAAAAMREIIPFFPKSEEAFDIVVELLTEMVPSEDQLRLLVKCACRSMDAFSIPALESILHNAGPSLSEAEAENRRLDKATEDYNKKLAQWREEAKLLPAAEGELPAAAPGPPIKPKRLHRPPAAEPAPVLREVGYLNGEGFTLQRPEPLTLRELEAQLEQDLKDAPVKSPDELAEKARLLEAEVMVRARFKVEDNQ